MKWSIPFSQSDRLCVSCSGTASPPSNFRIRKVIGRKRTGYCAKRLSGGLLIIFRSLLLCKAVVKLFMTGHLETGNFWKQRVQSALKTNFLHSCASSSHIDWTREASVRFDPSRRVTSSNYLFALPVLRAGFDRNFRPVDRQRLSPISISAIAPANQSK